MVPTLNAIKQSVTVKPYEVLVVYDFDEDTTVPVVKRLSRELPEVRLLKNDLGKGALNAIKAGLAADAAPHVLVTMADGSDQATDIDAIHALAHEGADVVCGSRYMRGGHHVGGPPLKKLMSRAAGVSLHWVGGLPVHDATNSFRLYSRRLLDQVTIESSGGFELGIELTVKAHQLGMRVAEVPTTWRDRTGGESRFEMRAWIPKYAHWYWKGMVSRLRRSRT